VNDPEGARDVKSVLLEPQLITRDNVKTVVDDGAVPASDICVAETAAACQELGISAS
jgi:D-xylose transport system substrate-binding protein